MALFRLPSPFCYLQRHSFPLKFLEGGILFILWAHYTHHLGSANPTVLNYLSTLGAALIGAYPIAFAALLCARVLLPLLAAFCDLCFSITLGVGSFHVIHWPALFQFIVRSALSAIDLILSANDSIIRAIWVHDGPMPTKTVNVHHQIENQHVGGIHFAGISGNANVQPVIVTESSQVQIQPPQQREVGRPSGAYAQPSDHSYLRTRLSETLLTDSQFNAFCLDHYPTVFRLFTNGMDRSAKMNLLLEYAEPHSLEQMLLGFTAGPESQFQRV